jgi:hypothetical protein
LVRIFQVLSVAIRLFTTGAEKKEIPHEGERTAIAWWWQTLISIAAARARVES